MTKAGLSLVMVGKEEAHIKLELQGNPEEKRGWQPYPRWGLFPTWPKLF